MKVIYSLAALNDLEEIWDWNYKHRGLQRATEYVDMLYRRMNSLEAGSRGQVIKEDPTYRYLIMQKRPNVDGHVAGFRIDQEKREIRILRVYHTKQDWKVKLKELS